MRKRERFEQPARARLYCRWCPAVLALRRVHPQTLARAGCRDTDEVDADGEPGVSVPRWSGARRASPPRRSPTSGVRCVRACPRARARGTSTSGGGTRGEVVCHLALAPAFRWGSAFSTTGGASAGVTKRHGRGAGAPPRLAARLGRWGWRSGRTRSRGLPSRRVQCRTISAARGEIRKFARSRCPSSRNSLR